jgi:hypothetical protein
VVAAVGRPILTLLREESFDLLFDFSFQLRIGAPSRHSGKPIVDVPHLAIPTEKESRREGGEILDERKLFSDVVSGAGDQNRICHFVAHDKLLDALAVVIEIAGFETQADYFEPC